MFVLVFLLLIVIFGVGLYFIMRKIKNRPLLKALLILLWFVVFILLCIALYRVYWAVAVSESGLVPF